MVPICPVKIVAKGQDTMARSGKEAIFGNKVLENQQLANVQNMDDDGIARLKTDIELREQNNSRFS
jgi:hypothetical protein